MDQRYEEIQKTFGEIAKNATLWWVDKRPHGWDEKRHLENPGVNCSNAKELDIAISVARLVTLSGVTTELPKITVNVEVAGDTDNYDEISKAVAGDGQ